MSDFKAKIYQIQFRLGLRSRPRWGSLQRSPDPLAGLRGSRLDYCNSLLVEISEQNLDSTQRVQSKAARIICNAGRHSPSSDLLHSLHWLPVRHRIEFKTATLCFKAVKLGAPFT